MRMKPYLTGHPDKVPLECYYKILNPELYTCYEIDNMIKKEFNEYNLKGSGGIEFYEVNKVTQDILEKYFNTMNILYEKCFDIIDENIHTITLLQFTRFANRTKKKSGRYDPISLIFLFFDLFLRQNGIRISRLYETKRASAIYRLIAQFLFDAQ